MPPQQLPGPFALSGFKFFAARAGLALLLLAHTALCPVPAIYNGSTQYDYLGCYNETTGIPHSTGARALQGGINEVDTQSMTVPACLDFCNQKGGTAYTYAGLEFARECWCGKRLSGLSVQFADDDCDLGCNGNETQACGGTLKLTVYILSSAGSVVQARTGILAVTAAAAMALNMIP